MQPVKKGLNLKKMALKGDKGLPIKKFNKPKSNIPKFLSIEKRKQEVIANIDNIPSLPTIIFEITKLANSPESSAGDIEASLKNDQVLTAKILKMANSSFYALKSQVNTPTRAVVTLGFNPVKSIVIAASASDTLNQKLGIYGYENNGLWSHSLCCAAISRFLGEKVYKLEEDQTEELFVAGLLHDIGKIAIAPILEKLKEDFLKVKSENPKMTLTEVENLVVGINHSEVGQILVDKWNLSERLRAAISGHHSDLDCESDHFQFSSIIRLADLICIENKIGIVDNYPWSQTIPEKLLVNLKIPEKKFHLLKEFMKNLIEKDITELINSMKF